MDKYTESNLLHYTASAARPQIHQAQVKMQHAEHFKMIK